jgi:7,8-dihydropterin-6-yl-methyl-4-(beta-D-ribofuranosyl)aminobenzene 5'-phosphate synthase
MSFLYAILVLVALVCLVFLAKVVQLFIGNKKVLQELDQLRPEKLSTGTVKKLAVLPLVDFYADDPGLKTEAGVSYLIQADDTKILMDVGFNKNREHPSPLLHNSQKLGVPIQDIDFLFISHRHLDHIGGMQEQKKKFFSLSQGKMELPAIPVYAPVPISPSPWNPGPRVEVINQPKVLANGIASIGSIPRNLFILGYTLENSLAIRVENKGIVIVIGCGHQTIERIIERTQALFNDPIYGIIGGLHFPVGNGRIMIGSINIQNLFGSDKLPWKGIREDDVTHAIQAIRRVNPQFVALSPHDSSDWSIDQFRKAFKDRYHDLVVGKEMVI